MKARRGFNYETMPAERRLPRDIAGNAAGQGKPLHRNAEDEAPRVQNERAAEGHEMLVGLQLRLLLATGGEVVYPETVMAAARLLEGPKPTPEPEIDRALAISEQTALGDERLTEDLSPSNRDAVLFPIRLLRLANNMAGDRGVPPFAELARAVGESKAPYNDQL